MRRRTFDSPSQPEMFGTGRVEAFSDGVIAVAITLLILDLKVPDPKPGQDLLGQLGRLWPNYLAYVISFLAIGVMWLGHHVMLRRLKAVDHTVLLANLLLLLCIVALPFTTSLFATYLDAPEGGQVAALVYAGSFLVTSTVFQLLQMLILLRREHLLHTPISQAERRTILWRGAVSIPTYLLAGALGLITPYLTFVVCIVAGIFYLIPLNFWRRT